MADDEKKTAPPVAETPEPSPPETAPEKGQEKPAAPKAAAKKTVKKAAPKKKRAVKKAAKATTEVKAAAAVAADSRKNAPIQVKLSAQDTGPAQSSGRRPEPPKKFWWRALLMVVAVVYLFSIIRDMAIAPEMNTAASRDEATAIIPAIPEEFRSSVADGDVVVEEAPSQPPADTAIPAPGYSGYPAPPQQPNYAPQPQQGGSADQPTYPMAPQGGYTYAYPWPTQPPSSMPYYWSPYYYFWSPPHYPWHPPYPGQPAPEQE